MSLTYRTLGSGAGWHLDDVICGFGPHDRPFEEEHQTVCIAAVTQGTFNYRSSHGKALLAPGTLLLGNHHHAFECSHDHSAGDRCVSFHFTPAFIEEVAAAVPGVRRADFALPRLPPQPALLPLFAAMTAARDGAPTTDDAAEYEEIALRLAGAVLAILADANRRFASPTARDTRRITAALQRIEAQTEESLSLAALAREAAMSPYHFLRTFRAVVGLTPHQYLLHLRMTRAAVRLRRTAEGVSAIAFAEGFNDLSTFNRRFARVMGATPSAYRAR